MLDAAHKSADVRRPDYHRTRATRWTMHQGGPPCRVRVWMAEPKVGDDAATAAAIGSSSSMVALGAE